MWLLQVLKRLDLPLLQTSANLSGQPPSRDPRQVLELLGSKLDLVVSAGTIPKKKSSTVVDATGNFPIILRQGAISRTRILNIARRD
jgi:tRNA A37 threonylcarbamoyladenosine synthetase subunit TsaC/SUA5/YrdC